MINDKEDIDISKINVGEAVDAHGVCYDSGRPAVERGKVISISPRYNVLSIDWGKNSWYG